MFLYNIQLNSFFNFLDNNFWTHKKILNHLSSLSFDFASTFIINLVGVLHKLINVVSPIFIIPPLLSWMCPKIWYFGLIARTASFKAYDPARFPFFPLSRIPKGGPWVINRSISSGIFFQITLSCEGLYWKALLVGF